ncbi:hypothetical protein BH09SUM1_BH09SUM1_03700 [soil metagenome]
MKESSSRILVDRSVLRLDGRPFFSFGPRVLLTSAEIFPGIMKDIADAGFSIVGTPPCSPGVLALIDAFFDAAEGAGLMVILVADPRLPEHGAYMAERFRHRRSLHSYFLPNDGAGAESLAAYLRDSDSIRASDLFHPIWTPLGAQQQDDQWLRAQDIYAPRAVGRAPAAGRLVHERVGEKLDEIGAPNVPLTPRPTIWPSLSVSTSDAERALGLFADDPAVSRHSEKALEWFPYLSEFDRLQRRDRCAPDPEILRIQLYDLLARGVRGALLDFFEAMGGAAPFSGRDRFCEAAILAQEVAVLHDFFAEGRPARVELDSGHPRLAADAIRHGREILIVLRMTGLEEEYFIDEAFMQRTEVSINVENAGAMRAWRMDFPAVRQLEISRDNVGSLRMLAGPLELTGVILLSPGSQRPDDIAYALQTRLPKVARFAVEQLQARLPKIQFIEDELRAMGAGIDNRERITVVRRGIDEAAALLKADHFAEAYTKARETGRQIRELIKYQMAKALSTPVFEKTGIRTYLRNSYYTLPRFYREGVLESARAFTDLT